MNILRIALNTRALIIFCFLAASAGGVRYALTPWQVFVFCDQKLPPDIQRLIKIEAEQSSLRSLGAQGFCETLQKQFPSVRSVSIAYKGSLAAQVMVKAHVPRVCLISTMTCQKEYVLCKGGLVIERKFFNELVTEGMPTVRIEGSDFEQKTSDPDLIACALELKGSLFEEYTVTWRTKVEILLQSRLCNSILIADTVTVHDKDRLEYVDRIFQSDPERYKVGIKADIRLRDEVICSPL